MSVRLSRAVQRGLRGGGGGGLRARLPALPRAAPAIGALSVCRRGLCSAPDKEAKAATEDSGGLLRWFVNFIPKDDTNILAKNLVKVSGLQAQNPNFHTHCGVCSDQGMVALTLKCLHVWILHQRIRDDAPENQEDLVYKIYETIWEDLDNELYDAGLTFLSRHMKEAQAGVYGSLASYDKTLQVYENDGDCDPFLGAVWRNLFNGDPNMDKAHLVQLRDYIFRELKSIKEMDEKAFYNGDIVWGPVPDTLPVSSVEADGIDPALAVSPLVNVDEGRRYLS